MDLGSQVAGSESRFAAFVAGRRPGPHRCSRTARLRLFRLLQFGKALLSAFPSFSVWLRRPLSPVCGLLISLCCRFIVFAGLHIQPVQWFQSFRHRWRFKRSGPPNDAGPKVGNLKPIRLALRADGYFAANNGTKFDNRRNADKIGRTLHPFGNIRNPRRDALRQKSHVESSNRQEAVPAEVSAPHIPPPAVRSPSPPPPSRARPRRQASSGIHWRLPSARASKPT